jgi:hypothetical protein
MQSSKKNARFFYMLVMHDYYKSQEPSLDLELRELDAVNCFSLQDKVLQYLQPLTDILSTFLFTITRVFRIIGLLFRVPDLVTNSRHPDSASLHIGSALVLMKLPWFAKFDDIHRQTQPPPPLLDLASISPPTSP